MLRLRHFNEYRLIINLKTVFTFFYLHRVKSTSHSYYTAIVCDSIRHTLLNELCKVDVKIPNDSDENLVNILFCYGLENLSFLNA